MNIQVRLFGSLVDLIGKSNVVVSNCKDTESLKEKLIGEYPGLKNCEFVISVNKKVVKNNQVLELGNDIAFLPPFAGG